MHAKARNLTKIPDIPPLESFAANNLTMRAQFFGCNEPNTTTIIWLPLVSYTSPPSNINTFSLRLDKATIDNLIRNGNLIATQNDEPDWPICLGCAIVVKSSKSLPPKCEACLQKYCVT